MSEKSSGINDEKKGNSMSFKLTVSDDGKNNVEMDKGSEGKVEDENLLLKLLKKLLELLSNWTKGEKDKSDKLLDGFVSAIKEAGIDVEVSDADDSKNVSVTLQNDKQFEEAKEITSNYIGQIERQQEKENAGIIFQNEQETGNVLGKAEISEENKDGLMLFVLIDDKLEKAGEAHKVKDGCARIYARNEEEANRMLPIAKASNSFYSALTGYSPEKCKELQDKLLDDFKKAGIDVRVGDKNGVKAIHIFVKEGQEKKIEDILKDHAERVKSLGARISDAKEQHEIDKSKGDKGKDSVEKSITSSERCG